MNKLLLSFGILLVLSCSAFAQERMWKTFSPDSGEWSILAPGVMKPDAEALESPSIEGSYSYNDFNGFFSVIYRDTPKGNVLWKPFKKAHYKNVRNSFIKSTKGKLLKDEEFSNGNIKGREVRIKMTDGRILGPESQLKEKYRVERLRMFFHGRRFYLLLVVLPEEEIDAPAIDNYLNSFVVK
jgi:hypothetical protein